MPKDGKLRFEKYLKDCPPLNKPALLRACFSLQKFRLLLGQEGEINIHLDVNKENARYIRDTLTRAGVKEIKETWVEQIAISNAIRAITLDDCLNYTGDVQRGDSISKSVKLPSAAEKKSGCMGFGKYKGESYQWMVENQRGYLEWAAENVDGFKNKIKSFLT